MYGMSLWGRHPGPGVFPGLCKGAYLRERKPCSRESDADAIDVGDVGS